MRVEGDTDHVERALGGGDDVMLPVALAGVGHGRKLEPGRPGVVVTDDAPQVGLGTEAPGSELVGGEDLLRVLVADLHIVQARIHTGAVERAHEVVAELVPVDQTAIADGAVEDLQCGAVGYPGGLVGHESLRGLGSGVGRTRHCLSIGARRQT